MATLGLIEYKDASPEVRAVYDDIMATRKTDWVNNFWKAIAHDPATLKRTWEDLKQIMAPGALDPLTKEMVYLAVSVSNQCAYCIASHTAGARNKGMTDAMFKELMAVVRGRLPLRGFFSNLCSCRRISTRRPRKATPSACRRSRCSTAESPRSLISPPAPTIRCHGSPKERCSVWTTWRAPCGYPAARATAP